jgi:SAM-dependent methyltransferase
MQCPACTSIAVTVHDTGSIAPFVAHRTGVSETRTCTCSRCGLRFSSHRWTPQQAISLYAGYRDPDYDRERQAFEPGYSSGHLNAPRDYLPDIEAWVTEYLNPASVLDIGGNDGRNTPFADRATVWEIGDPEPDGTYDLIVLAHVLEHAPWPRDLLAVARRHIAPNGLIYAEVPIEPLMDVWHEHISRFDETSLAATLHPCTLLGLRARATSLGPVLQAIATPETTWHAPPEPQAGADAA